MLDQSIYVTLFRYNMGYEGTYAIRYIHALRFTERGTISAEGIHILRRVV